MTPARHRSGDSRKVALNSSFTFRITLSVELEVSSVGSRYLHIVIELDLPNFCQPAVFIYQTVVLPWASRLKIAFCGCLLTNIPVYSPVTYVPRPWHNNTCFLTPLQPGILHLSSLNHPNIWIDIYNLFSAVGKVTARHQSQHQTGFFLPSTAFYRRKKERLP